MRLFHDFRERVRPLRTVPHCSDFSNMCLGVRTHTQCTRVGERITFKKLKLGNNGKNSTKKTVERFGIISFRIFTHREAVEKMRFRRQYERKLSFHSRTDAFHAQFSSFINSKHHQHALTECAFKTSFSAVFNFA